MTNQRLDQTRTELRAEIAQTRTELRAEIAETRTELAETRTELRGQILEAELRMATRTVEQTAATRDLHAMLVGQLELRDRVERCEHDISDLKKRVG